MVTRAELLAQLAALPPECEGCGAPLVGDICEYCGRSTAPTTDPDLPDEPPDIRRTNASDDPCPMCQQVHPKDSNTPLTCRCLYCGQIGPVAMSTYDPVLGFGIVCRVCLSGGRPAPQPSEQMPWEAA